MTEPRAVSISWPASHLAAGLVAIVLLLVAALAGALATWGVDPGFAFQPLPALFAAGLGGIALALSWFLSRRLSVHLWYLLGAAAASAVAGGTLLYVTAPRGIDRAAYTRVEQAMLAQIAPYPGASSSDVRTMPASSSDWGISFLNPPETYLTARTDSLPAGSSISQVADVYERELRRAGLEVSRFRLHLPTGQVEVDGEHGAASIEATIGRHAAELVARCQRNGPFLPNVLEPPCRPPSTP